MSTTSRWCARARIIRAARKGTARVRLRPTRWRGGNEMTIQAILLPLFVQVALTLVMLGLTGYSRVASVRRGDTKVKDIALGQPNWPEDVTKLGNSYNNQFQLPVLFYAVVILAYVLRKTDLLFVILSWLFVATRLVH